MADVVAEGGPHFCAALSLIPCRASRLRSAICRYSIFLDSHNTLLIGRSTRSLSRALGPPPRVRFLLEPNCCNVMLLGLFELLQNVAVCLRFFVGKDP